MILTSSLCSVTVRYPPKKQRCPWPAGSDDRLDLGTAFANVLANEFVKPLLLEKTVVLIRTSTADKLPDKFAQALEDHGRFRAILVVGHSNASGLQLARDVFSDWQTVGKWLRPFAPEYVFLAACEAGKSEAVRNLFGPLKQTLQHVYASPVRIFGAQAAAFAVLIGMLLWNDGIADEHSITLRLLNYINTGGQVYHWSYDETGPAAEVPAQWWDALSAVFDHGPWDLQQRITEFIQARCRKPTR